jgi:hypothetical protein
MDRPLTVWERRRNERDDEVRFTTSLAAFAVTLVIGVIGLYVMEGLAQTAKLEDCLLQGRLNCLRIDITSLRSPAFFQ